MKFKLSFHWYGENIESHSCHAAKEFKTKTPAKSWSLARKWMDNCIAICGKSKEGAWFRDCELVLIK